MQICEKSRQKSVNVIMVFTSVTYGQLYGATA